MYNKISKLYIYIVHHRIVVTKIHTFYKLIVNYKINKSWNHMPALHKTGI